MKMQMFAIFDKGKPNRENTRGLNLAVVTCTAIQVTGLLQQHVLLVRDWKRPCIYCIYMTYTVNRHSSADYDGPVLSLERVPHEARTETVKQ
jgi:hypothetical protein